MRKWITAFISFALCLLLTSCGIVENPNVDFDNTGAENSSSTTVPNTVSTETKEKIYYISDRRTQYDEAKKQHTVFFGLQTMSGRYADASGYANIEISDKAGDILYSKKIRFTPADFTEWTNQNWDSSRYMCGLYINQEDIEGSGSSSGDLSLEVILDDGTWFEADSLVIFDLPAIQVSIDLPELPETHIDEGYSYSSTVSITKLTYTSTTNYDGKASIDFEVIIKLEDKTSKRNESDYVRLEYKLYDSEGIVVDSGTILTNPIAIGESTKETFMVWDLDPKDHYVLKFSDAS